MTNLTASRLADLRSLQMALRRKGIIKSPIEIYLRWREYSQEKWASVFCSPHLFDDDAVVAIMSEHGMSEQEHIAIDVFSDYISPTIKMRKS